MAASRIEARGWDHPPSTSREESSCAAQPATRAQALARVVPALQGPLLRFLTKRTGSPEEARDIIQETYVRVLSVEPDDSIHALDRYLWRCALNIMNDRRRSSRCRERLVQVLSGRPEQFAPSAETVADARERLALVGEAVHELPPRCYQAFLLRIVRYLPFEDVGQEMRISSRMAKIYVARTVKYLRRRLDPPASERHSIDRTEAPVSSPVRISSPSARQLRSRVARGCGARKVVNGGDQNEPIDHGAHVNAAVAPRVNTALTDTAFPPSGECPMKYTDATSVLKALIEGHEPGSDVPLPAESVVHRPDVLRSLLAGVAALERVAARDQRRALLPDNVGRSWTADEETRMAEAFKAGESPELIARNHRRTLRAIEARLQRMGLLNEEDRTTHGGFATEV